MGSRGVSFGGDRGGGGGGALRNKRYREKNKVQGKKIRYREKMEMGKLHQKWVKT